MEMGKMEEGKEMGKGEKENGKGEKGKREKNGKEEKENGKKGREKGEKNPNPTNPRGAGNGRASIWVKKTLFWGSNPQFLG